MVVEVQQLENRIFWCGFGFHQDFCIGTVKGEKGSAKTLGARLTPALDYPPGTLLSGHFSVPPTKNNF